MALPQSMDPKLRRQIEAAADRSDTSVDEWIERAARRELEREKVHGSVDRADMSRRGDAQSRSDVGPSIGDDIEALLVAVIQDRDSLYLPPAGARPQCIESPIKLGGDKTMAETIIEERGER